MDKIQWLIDNYLIPTQKKQSVKILRGQNGLNTSNIDYAKERENFIKNNNYFLQDLFLNRDYLDVGGGNYGDIYNISDEDLLRLRNRARTSNVNDETRSYFVDSNGNSIYNDTFNMSDDQYREALKNAFNNALNSDKLLDRYMQDYGGGGWKTWKDYITATRNNIYDPEMYYSMSVRNINNENRVENKKTQDRLDKIDKRQEYLNKIAEYKNSDLFNRRDFRNMKREWRRTQPNLSRLERKALASETLLNDPKVQKESYDSIVAKPINISSVSSLSIPTPTNPQFGSNLKRIYHDSVITNPIEIKPSSNSWLPPIAPPNFGQTTYSKNQNVPNLPEFPVTKNYNINTNNYTPNLETKPYTPPTPPATTTPPPASTNSNISFNKAFGNARKAGNQQFEWRGKLYGTMLKGESKEQWLENLSKNKPKVVDPIY